MASHQQQPKQPILEHAGPSQGCSDSLRPVNVKLNVGVLCGIAGNLFTPCSGLETRSKWPKLLGSCRRELSGAQSRAEPQARATHRLGSQACVG